MSKLKKLTIALLAITTATCASLGITACDKSTTVYPDYVNPSISAGGGSSDTNTSNVYTINVKSLGGLSLSNVKVAIKKDGITLYEGISQSGKITIPLDPDVYELVVDESTLPTGYYIPEGSSFETKKDEFTVDIELPSRIISTSAPTGTTYSLGDVMYDFSYTDTSGTRYSLSETLADKKAVVLNFWYTTCSACILEFPVLQNSYLRYSQKLEVVALSSSDSNSAITEFQNSYALNSLRMARDSAGITKAFNVQYFPTTVIVDRFGVIVYIDSGAITDEKNWNALFNTYTSDDYVQNVTSSGDDSDGDAELERVKPSVEMSDAALIAAAVNGSGTTDRMSKFYPETETADAEYSWGWIVGSDNTYTGIDGTGKYIAASNINVDNSFATIYVDVTLKSGDILSYDYNYTTQSESDYLYVIIDSNRDTYKMYSGDSDGWQTEHAVYVAKRDETIQIAMIYTKNGAYSEDNEHVWISNFTIENAESTKYAQDICVSVVSGTPTNGFYPSYQTVKLNPEDNYYHIYDETTGTYGALLLADILSATSWSDLHIGAKTFDNGEGTLTATSLYLLSYWNMSNQDTISTENGDSLKFDYDKTGKLSEVLIDNYYYQGFSDNGYVPVDEELKELLVTFTKYYHDTYEKGGSYDENKTWLELCYYGKHYGGEHLEGDEDTTNVDPIKALSYKNAYEIKSGETLTVNITKIISYNGGGLFYKFVPTQSGVYHIATGTVKNSAGVDLDAVDPVVVVRSEDQSVLKYLDNNDTPATLTKANIANRYHVYAYVYFEAGETYYLQCRESYAQDEGTYSLTVKPVLDTDGTIAQSYDYLRVCTTDDGAWDYSTFNYSAIDVATEGGYYHALNADYSTGSLIYIDFIHPNFYDTNDHTLKEIIDEGYFNFTSFGDKDYTNEMNEYYTQAISRDESDPLYGMLEASEELVDLIAKHLSNYQGEDKSTGYWLSLAVYFEHIGK